MSRIFISGRGELPTEIETPRILPNLDLVRAAAISGVIAFHYLGAQFRFPSSGWTGVWLFFVLSGFLITRGLLAQTHRPLRDYLGRFYKRRALRIFPLYFSYLFTIGVISFAFAVPLAPPDSAPLAWLVL